MELDVGTVLDGKYEIEGRLGAGGMGVVYRAHQINLGRPVAVKVLAGDATARAAALERFRREAFVVARLRHPNIVTIHDVGDAEGVGAYIVLELLDGRTLEDEIAQRGRLEPPEALAVARQVCAALGAAHAAGVVHRDLKPANVFLERGTHGATAKVLDFGVAKLRGADGLTIARVTAAGAIVGTPIYMSPEQCEGRELDARSDVYSLGCVLFEMLAGRPPFLADSFYAAIRMHTSQPPEPPSRFAQEISSALDAVVLRLLEKRPADRYASIADVEHALASCMSSDLLVASGSAMTVVEERPVGTDDGDARAVAPRTRRTPPNNLASDVTSFVGRASERAELAAALRTTRLLTLSGTGGVGKTRLALELARTALDWCDDGVWFADLSTTSDAALVPQAVASALGLREEPGRSIVETLVAALREKRALLVLDDCEHLVRAAAELATLLARECGALHVLATSREVFGVAGEVVWMVRPLDVSTAGGSDAARLFADRVRLRDRTFVLDERSAGVVAEICTRLDGLPLAIELAAARASVLTLDQILEKLGDRFRLLTGGDRTSLPRRQTLKATLDWSFELLSDEERRLFERVAVFVGGFTLDAAGAVAALGDDERGDVLDLLQRLVDKSLVATDRRAHGSRFRMLETIREYALERLRASSDEERAYERHAEYFIDFAKAARERVDGPEQMVWMDRLGAELDNMRAVLRRSAARADWETVAGLGHALFLFWTTRGYWSEGRDTILPAVESGAAIPETVLAGALYTLGALEMRRAEFTAAETYLNRALEIRQRLGETILAASTMRMLGTLLLRKGELDRATPLLEGCLEVYRDAGDDMRTAWALSGLGLVAMDSGDWVVARERMEESLELSRKTGAARHAASALYNLGEITYCTGDLDRAEALAAECQVFANELGDRQLVGFTVVLFANIAAARGDLARAEALYGEALEKSREIGDMLVVVQALEGLATVAEAGGDARRALDLLDEAASVRATRGFVPSAHEHAVVDACRRAATARLGGGA